uniref:Uncharacterized protein n=1 Tax=Globodera rostochiensis TaxID=31243 RepID=A0A914HSK9_GLORO
MYVALNEHLHRLHQQHLHQQHLHSCTSSFTDCTSNTCTSSTCTVAPAPSQIAPATPAPAAPAQLHQQLHRLHQQHLHQQHLHSCTSSFTDCTSSICTLAPADASVQLMEQFLSSICGFLGFGIDRRNSFSPKGRDSLGVIRRPWETVPPAALRWKAADIRHPQVARGTPHHHYHRQQQTAKQRRRQNFRRDDDYYSMYYDGESG